MGSGIRAMQGGRDVRVSVVVVSDYEAGEKRWTDERAAIRAFVADDPGFAFEVIVMESLAGDGQPPPVPDDIAALAPKVRIHFAPTAGSSALKDAALKHCRADLIAVVEADCLPEKGWLKHLVAALDADPALDIVSGRTIYGGETAMQRVTTLLDRGFAECRYNGRLAHISNNGAIYRRSVLERFPYPDDPNPFVTGELRQDAMLRAGVKIGLETRAVMRHAYGGLPFLIDVRRNKGHQAARILLERSPRAAARPLLVNAAAAVYGRLLFDMETVRQVGRNHLHPRDWPLLWFMMLALRLPEFAGALSAGKPERFGATTAYR